MPERQGGERTAYRLAIAATAAAWVPPLVFGWLWRDYSLVGDFISELGADGAPHARLVNATFAVAGALFIAACVAIGRARAGWRLPLALLSVVGVSYVVAAFVPCDAGCPGVGSGRQAIHNTVGAAAYFLAGLGLLRLAGPLVRAGQPGAATLARVAGLVAVAGVIAMGAPELAAFRGAIQRLVELAAFASLLTVARCRPTPASEILVAAPGSPP